MSRKTVFANTTLEFKSGERVTQSVEQMTRRPGKKAARAPEAYWQSDSKTSLKELEEHLDASLTPAWRSTTSQATFDRRRA